MAGKRTSQEEPSRRTHADPPTGGAHRIPASGPGDPRGEKRAPDAGPESLEDLAVEGVAQRKTEARRESERQDGPGAPAPDDDETE